MTIFAPDKRLPSFATLGYFVTNLCTFWCPFYRPKYCGGVPKLTNIRYVRIPPKQLPQFAMLLHHHPSKHFYTDIRENQKCFKFLPKKSDQIHLVDMLRKFPPRLKYPRILPQEGNLSQLNGKIIILLTIVCLAIFLFEISCSQLLSISSSCWRILNL